MSKNVSLAGLFVLICIAVLVYLLTGFSYTLVVSIIAGIAMIILEAYINSRKNIIRQFLQ